MNTRTPRPAIIDGDIARIPLGVGAKDGYALVDEEYAFLDRFKWHFDGRYAATRIFPYDRKVRLHHFVRPIVDDFVVDHINRDSLDNRRANLRLCSRAENQQNMEHVEKAKRIYSAKRGWFIFLPEHVIGKKVWRGYFKSYKEAQKALKDLLS